MKTVIIYLIGIPVSMVLFSAINVSLWHSLVWFIGPGFVAIFLTAYFHLFMGLLWIVRNYFFNVVKTLLALAAIVVPLSLIF